MGSSAGTMIMALPNEILIQIFSLLSAKDCKVIRLISRRWHNLATQILFDLVLVRPHSTSLRSFKAITRHPVLRTVVTKLSFDVRFFEPVSSREEFLPLLLRQIRLGPRKVYEECVSGNVPRESRELVEYALQPSTLRPKEAIDYEKKLCDSAIVEESYGSYSRRATDQIDAPAPALFWYELAKGLRQLPRIRDVEFDCCWISYHHKRFGPYQEHSPFRRAERLWDVQPGWATSGFNNIYCIEVIGALQSVKIVPRSLWLPVDVVIQREMPLAPRINTAYGLLNAVKKLCLGLGSHLGRDLLEQTK